MVSQSIALDFIRAGAPKMVFAKQGDGGSREIAASLYEEGVEYTPTSSATVELAFKKQSGKKIKAKGSLYMGNVVKATLTDDMLDEPGLAECVFTIHESSPITTQTFYVMVEDSPNYEATESGDLVLQSKYVDPSLAVQTVIADPGYDGLSSVEIGAMRETAQATPKISIDQSTGKITAEAKQVEGYVAEGTKKDTLQLPTVGGKTITPGTVTKKVADAGSYLLGDLYVASVPSSPSVGVETVPVTISDSNLINLVEVSYVGVENGNPVAKTARVIHTDWNSGEPINVVKNTDIIVKNGDAGATVDLAVSDGFESIDRISDQVIVCRVGEVACQLAPSQTYAPDDSGNSFVVGKWTCIRQAGYPQPFIGKVDVNFVDDTLDREEWVGIEGRYYINGDGWLLNYISASGNVTMAIDDGSWEDQGRDIIDFGTTPQIVPSAFAEWLADNFTYQTSGGGGSAPTLVSVRLTNNAGREIGVHYTGYEEGGTASSLTEMGPGESTTIICVDRTIILLEAPDGYLSCDYYGGKLSVIKGDNSLYAFRVDDRQSDDPAETLIDFS